MSPRLRLRFRSPNRFSPRSLRSVSANSAVKPLQFSRNAKPQRTPREKKGPRRSVAPPSCQPIVRSGSPPETRWVCSSEQRQSKRRAARFCLDPDLEGSHQHYRNYRIAPQCRPRLLRFLHSSGSCTGFTNAELASNECPEGNFPSGAVSSRVKRSNSRNAGLLTCASQCY